MELIRALVIGFLVFALSGGAFSQSDTPGAGSSPEPIHESITGVVVFGDSLSDIGNVFVASGIPTAPYFEGRFSNGPVWVEYLVERLELPALSASLRGGENFAYASAETGSGLAPVGVPNILTQIETYLAQRSPRPGELFAIWGGGNDFFNGETDPAVPIGHLRAAVTSLAERGGALFVVPNLIPLGYTPLFQQMEADDRQAVNAITLEFNRLLAVAMRELEDELGIRVLQLDVAALGEQVVFDPARFGFTNLSNGAIQDGVLSGEGYLFWDRVHPTTAANEIIGDAAFELIAREILADAP